RGAVSHLRHPLRTDECARFDDAQTGVAERGDVVDLRLRRDGYFLVLQAVARTDFDDLHGFNGDFHVSVTRSTPGCTSSPSLQLIAAIVPSRGAVIWCSIFIASRISSGAPFCTTSPAAAKIFSTTPGIGA